MNAILYSPVKKIRDEREGFIEGNLAIAESNKQEAETLLLEKEEKLKEARKEASSIVLSKTG